MSNNEQEILKIFNLLESKHQDDLLTWVHLAYKAENSARKALCLNGMTKNTFSPKKQECSCKN